MYKFIFYQWKSRKATIFLILIGFFIGCLVMSIGTSACKEQIEQINDQKMGNPKEQLEIYFSCKKVNRHEKVKKLVEAIGEFGAVQILSLQGLKIDGLNETYSVVPILFQEEPDWHIPLTEGTYFDQDSMNTSSKEIIIGKSIAEKCKIKTGDTVSLQGDTFLVRGICGRATRGTSWECAVYIPWHNYYSMYWKSLDAENALSLHLGRGKNDFLERADEYADMAEQMGIDLTYKIRDDVDESSLKNTFTLVIMSTMLVFIIAIINITHLMFYWLLERKREIGIMKALGANNAFIVRSIIGEVLLMALISCLMAILVQYVLMLLLGNTFLGKEIPLQISWINLLCSISISLFFGLIAAIAPAWNSMRFEPVSVINNI